VAVLKKYSDDRGGQMSALITFYGFLAVFPLLLLLVTVVGLVVGPRSHAEQEIVNSALSQFPVIGERLGSSIKALHKPSALAFVVSLVGLLWGSLGVTNTIQAASATMWGVPRHQEATLLRRIGRGLLLLGTIATAVVGSAVLAGLSTVGGGKLSSSPAAYWAFTLVGAAVVNLGAYFLALRILAPAGTGWRSLVPGTLIGGLGWTVLETLGGLLVSHVLRHTSQLYGFFAIVLGLIFWLSLGSQLFVYAGQTNVVLARHQWPRHIDDPPPGPAAGTVAAGTVAAGSVQAGSANS
jgi:YihY family inner membrane protein